MENINNSPVQEPENSLRTKKKKFEKPELFMILAAVIANGIIPFIADIYDKALDALFDVTINSVETGNFIRPMASLTKTIPEAVLIFAVIALFAFLSYKSNRIKNAALFLGAFYASQSVTQVFVQRPLISVLKIFVTVINAIGDLIGIYGVVSNVTNFIQALMLFVINSLVYVIITAVIGFVFLRIVNGRIKLKKKKKEEPKAPETPVN